MFSYCKRSGTNKNTKFPFSSHLSGLHTTGGFGKGPLLCDNIQMPFVHNRGLPRNLLDFEAKLQGKDPEVQPYCSDPSTEDADQLQFSHLDWLKGQPIPRGPIPCAPTPMVEVKGYGGSACDHAGGVRPCGGKCGCSPRCQCKEMWRERNMTRPAIGVMGMSAVPGCKYKF